MKTRTNQPVFLDNGQLVDDNNLGGKLYNHIVCVGRTNDMEDDPWLIVNFQSPKSTYTKQEFMDFVSNVASVDVASVYMGIIANSFNGGYAVNKLGLYSLYKTGPYFYGKCLSNGAQTTITFGTTFAYFNIKSAEI